MKNELFANVSHEFRTPLTLVMTQLKALRDVDAARVDAGLRNCARLLLLVDELLDLARLRGRADLQRQRADLARLVNDVVSAFRSDERPADELTVTGTGEPLAAWVDPRQIRTAIYNLLSNAYKFSDAASRRVRVEVRKLGEMVEITVEDNGIGIPTRQLERVFERFVQVEGGAARRQGGVGIGLALVQEIARAHGGQVTVDSEPGRGSRFTISLPSWSPEDAVAEGPAEAAGTGQLEIFKLARSPVPETSAAALGGAPRGQRVLVVEDDPELRAHLSAVLASRFVVTAAADGAEALERAAAEPPDLLVTDLMTPRLSGLELLRALRRDETARRARVPALVITARAAVDARAEAYAAGADDFLSKPFDDGELLARADNLLVLRRQEQELARLNARLEARVAERTAELRRLAAHLETAREDERRRIAREIHDEAGQLLSALRMELSVARKSAKNGAEGVTEALARMDAILDDALRIVRELVADLRPRVLDEMGLCAALQWYVRRFQEMTGVTCELSVDEIAAPPEVATASFRIVQEALTNVARHAGARRVQIALRREGDAIHVSVTDDGRGFDLPARRSAGFGLLGMSERAQALGGALDVSTEPGRGTTCTVRFPIAPPQPAA
jgi:signal transduction histidine kinase